MREIKKGERVLLHCEAVEVRPNELRLRVAGSRSYVFAKPAAVKRPRTFAGLEWFCPEMLLGLVFGLAWGVLLGSAIW